MRATAACGLLAILVLLPLRPASAEDARLPPPGRTGAPSGTQPTSPTPRPIPPSAASTASTPAAGLAMPSDYRLAAGDEIEVEVVLPKAVEAETTNPFREGRRFIVASGGRLSVPRVKDVELFGRTIADVQKDIERRIVDSGMATAPDVFVRVTAYAPRFVHLVNAVWKKIEISPFGRANLLTVLAEAGEAMKDVDVGSIEIISVSTGQHRTVNFRHVLAAGGLAAESWLEPGDILNLRRAEKVEKTTPVVYIGGYVKTPGAYALEEPGRSGQPITVTRLVYIAGGATELGNLQKVTIRRIRGQPEVQTVNVFAIMSNRTADVPLMADDMVFVND